MTEPEIIAAHSLAELSAFLEETGNKITAGGTEILSRPCSDAVKLIDISLLSELSVMREQDNRVEIGSCVTLEKIINSPMILRTAPILVDACCKIADEDVRRRATIGGNIAECSPEADTIPALMAMKAKITIKTDSDIRETDADHFFLRADKYGIKPGEVITKISFIKPKGQWGEAYCKLGIWKADPTIRFSGGAFLNMDESCTIETSRIAVTAIHNKIVKCRSAEKILNDHPADDELASKAADAVVKDCADAVEENMADIQKKVLYDAFEQLLQLCMDQSVEKGLQNFSGE